MHSVVAALALLLVASPVTAGGQSDAAWQFGGFADIAYLFDTTDPPDHLARSRGTSFRVNDLSLNMIGVSARKTSIDTSRWGVELLLHAGRDSEVFGFSPTAPRLDDREWLNCIGRANVSYLAAAGDGLLVQAGIFASPIGYDSLYAKDNANYTRPWTADFTPYLMLGANAAYTRGRTTAAIYVVNGYWHLSHGNDAPNVAMQLVHAASAAWTFKQAILIGPHQSNTAASYWRVLSDTILERRSRRWIVAIDAQAATEEVIGPDARGWWLAAQAPVQWISEGPWRVTVRPEMAWDSNGRWTAFEQTVTALTATLDYRLKMKRGATSLRLEYRTDHSTGPQGGFSSRDGMLVPRQHLLIGAVVMNIE